MNPTSPITAPDWLVPGAEVLLFTSGNPGTPVRSTRTTVKKVAGQSFTVEAAREPRFRIKTMSAEQGHGWSAWLRRVVPADSDEARQVLAEEHRQRLVAKADRAYEAWCRDRTAENLAVLTSTLHAIEKQG